MRTTSNNRSESKPLFGSIDFITNFRSFKIQISKFALSALKKESAPKMH